jgi:hypothetical protein
MKNDYLHSQDMDPPILMPIKCAPALPGFGNQRQALARRKLSKASKVESSSGLLRVRTYIYICTYMYICMYVCICMSRCELLSDTRTKYLILSTGWPCIKISRNWCIKIWAFDHVNCKVIFRDNSINERFIKFLPGLFDGISSGIFIFTNLSLSFIAEFRL